MDGYSVNEAAAVLGIPEGRVWELLARGVLSGSTEVGGDMRVFLREVAVVEAPKREGNGNGGNGGHGEQTPFRELLTEFRNLTERYGQALLALGEARGEVASLRGRVDLLEARIEHRLPWTEAASSAWASPAEGTSEAAEDADADAEPDDEPEPQPSPARIPQEPLAESERAPETAVETTSKQLALESDDVMADILDATLGPGPAQEPEVEPKPGPAEGEVPEPEAELEPTDEAQPESELEPMEEPAEDLEPAKPRPIARGGSREALSGFAEALARAQDPATASVAADFDELPGAQETADAVAAYRRETEIVGDETSFEPPEEPEVEAERSSLEPEVTEAVTETAVVSIVRPGYSTDTPEPDWIAEEDLIILAGEDASVRADELAHQAATAPSVAWPDDEEEEEEVAEARIVEPEAVDTQVEAELEAEVPGGDRDRGPSTRGLEEAAPAVIAAAAPEPVPEPAVAPAPEIESAPEIPSPPAPPAARESNLTPVEIAAEPPASDDVALLVGPEPFAEPPIVPPEPAFWETGAGSRAPFAIAQPDPWDAGSVEPMPVEVAVKAAPVAPDEPAEPLKEAPAMPVTPKPASKAPEPPPLAPEPTEAAPDSAPSPPRLSPAAEAGRAAAARRRRRPQGPAARALRRLRYLLD